MVKALNLLTKGILQIAYENTFLKKKVNVIDKRVVNTSEWSTFFNFTTLSFWIFISQPTTMISAYNESDIQLAIQAHQRDPHISISKLAKIYHVPNTTLRRRIKGKPARRNIMANSRKLTVFEEEAIVSFIIDLDARSFPPRYSYVEDMANRMLA